MKYPHHNLVVDWLGGQAIQYKEDGLWQDMPGRDTAAKLPHFYRDREYRHKPVVLRFRLAAVDGKVVAVNSLQEERVLPAAIVWLTEWEERTL